MVPNIDSRIVTDILSEPCRASLYHRLFVYWHVLNKSPCFWPSQTQSFATANAKLCNRQRKALQSSTQSFASVNANVFADYWLLIVDCWLLIVDCWLLITDCWLLIIDYWRVLAYHNSLIITPSKHLKTNSPIWGQVNYTWNLQQWGTDETDETDATDILQTFFYIYNKKFL